MMESKLSGDCEEKRRWTWVREWTERGYCRKCLIHDIISIHADSFPGVYSSFATSLSDDKCLSCLDGQCNSPRSAWHPRCMSDPFDCIKCRHSYPYKEEFWRHVNCCKKRQSLIAILNSSARQCRLPFSSFKKQ